MSPAYMKDDFYKYRQDGFDDVLTTPKEVVKKVIHCIETDFVVESGYTKRVSEAFIHFDKKNSERLIDYIQSLYPEISED